jgi:hypothetical protein
VWRQGDLLVIFTNNLYNKTFLSYFSAFGIAGMEYTKRNKQSTINLTETPALLAHLQCLQTQLPCTDKAEQLCHELLATLAHALQNEHPQHLAGLDRDTQACFDVKQRLRLRMRRH